MKNPVTYCRLIFLIPAIMLSSCTYSQLFDSVKGTGMSIDRNFNVSDFKGIDVSGGFDVTLVQGNTESLTLTAQKNLFNHITVEVDNGTLKVYTRNNLMATQPMKARITFKSVSDLKVSGGGDVTSETPVNVEALDIYVSGGGDFSSVINSEELKCHISGGDVKAGNLLTDITSFNASGGSDIHVNVSKELTGHISGGGDVYYSGNPGKISIDARGGSEVHKE